MANNENLKKGKATQFKSGEEAAMAGRKGGKASGESRRKNADLRKTMEKALNGTYKVKTKDGEQEMTGAEMLVASMIQIAANSKSKSAVAAFNTILKMMGQDVPEHNNDDDDQVRAFLNAIKGGSDD